MSAPFYSCPASTHHLSPRPKILKHPILCFLNLSSTPLQNSHVSDPVSLILCPTLCVLTLSSSSVPLPNSHISASPSGRAHTLTLGRGTQQWSQGRASLYKSRVKPRIVKSSLVHLKAVQCSTLKPIWCQFIASKLQNQCKSSALQTNVTFAAAQCIGEHEICTTAAAAEFGEQQMEGNSQQPLPPSPIRIKLRYITLYFTLPHYLTWKSDALQCIALHCWPRVSLGAAANCSCCHCYGGNLRQIRSSPSSSES